MRTTLNTIYARIQSNLGKITADMSKINAQISSGQQISTISENPVNLVSALSYRTTIVELMQYNENIQNGNTIINVAELALTQMKEITLRAKTLAIQATDPGYTATNREAIAVEVNNLFRQAVSLANTQVNGKYIFGGFRTTGYNEVEPAPFIMDKGDGHWINGTGLAPLQTALTSGAIESAATVTDLAGGDLLINGVDIGAVDLNAVPDTFGVNMAGADTLKSAISLYVGGTATADTAVDGLGNTFSFDLNGVPISFTTDDADVTAAAVRDKAFAAINLETANTGVVAIKGFGPPTDGFPADSLVFQNAQEGDYSTIAVANFSNVGAGGAALGFTDFSKQIAPATPTLTTQISGLVPPGDGVAPVGGALGNQFIDFTVNGVRVAYTTQGTVDAQGSAEEAIDAINAVSDETGVTALLGDGTNGGPLNSVILRNTLDGDETAITLAGLAAGPPDEIGITGLTNNGAGQAADFAHNTGRISLFSRVALDITTSSATTIPPSDLILDRIGLGGGNIGNFDEAADGKLVYGYPLSSGELKINGIDVPAPTDDTLSDVYGDASAAAKAAAINSITGQTGVSAVITNAETKAAAAVTAGTELIRPTGAVSNTVIRAGDLAINGIPLSTEISSGVVTNGLCMEKAANAEAAIYAESLTTGVIGRLTTLLPNNTVASTTGTGAAAPLGFTINGVNITLNTGSKSANKTANDVAAAINAVKDQTGVEAIVGDGTNGGAVNSVVLFNSVKGNEDAIAVAGLDVAEANLSGLLNINQAANLANNTGEISLESENPITLTSPTIFPGADAIINELGFSSQNVTGFGGPTSVTATVTGVSITAPNPLYVNGVPAGNIIGGAPTLGLNMDMAFSAKTQIEAADPDVRVQLTTLRTNNTAAGITGGPAIPVSFSVNGVAITLDTGDVSTTDTASDVVAAINAVKDQTGVEARVGDGANGGAIDSVVLFNSGRGNEGPIVIAGLDPTDPTDAAEIALIGLTDGSQAADATNNTGQITVSSDTTFDLSTPTVGNDAVLNRLGLGFGALSGYSEKADGIFYSTDGTGEGQASFGASPEFMTAGDLLINGEDIFITPTAVLENDQTNAVIDAINAKTATTGVQATRGTDGRILLAAIDGRNIHVQTTPNGEAITHLTAGSRDQVTFGSLQLASDRKFFLETIDPALNADEPGLATLGLAGGQTISGEPGDVAGDGKIDVFSIHDQTGSVRYAGDRINDLEIKIGKNSTMTIGANGMDGVMDTSIFSTLKALENYLLNDNFTTVTGIHTASDTTVGLNSKATGLEPESQLPSEDLFTNGSFTVSVIDLDYPPPGRQTALTIGVDTAVDTLDSVARRIDGIPHVKASWVDGQLTIESDDPARYTIALSYDSSNFLEATGVSPEFMQSQGIVDSIAGLDTVMENLTRQVSDFGARANRIDIQSQIYDSMNITANTDLSEVQDTDMIKAAMDLQAKQTAYQAALSAAAKTMQLSLVDYLK